MNEIQGPWQYSDDTAMGINTEMTWFNAPEFSCCYLVMAEYPYKMTCEESTMVDSYDGVVRLFLKGDQRKFVWTHSLSEIIERANGQRGGLL